jgi:hypothetical protein
VIIVAAGQDDAFCPAAAVLLAGVMKVAVPKEKLLGTMVWAKAWPPARLKALGGPSRQQPGQIDCRTYVLLCV